MNDSKFLSLAKGMKWVPFVFGLAFLVAAVLAIWLKTNDPEEKWSLLAFLSFGLIAMTVMTTGYSIYAIMWKLAKGKEEDVSEDDD